MSNYEVVCVDLDSGEESDPFTVRAPTACGHNKIIAAARLMHPKMQVDRYSR